MLDHLLSGNVNKIEALEDYRADMKKSHPTEMEDLVPTLKDYIIRQVLKNEFVSKSQDFTLTYKGYWVDCECENDCGNHREYRIECNIDMNDIEDEDKN